MSNITKLTTLTPLYDHVMNTADELGHSYTMSIKEWDASNPPFPGQMVVPNSEMMGAVDIFKSHGVIISSDKRNG
jgi:hypothetical protein